MAAPNSVLWTSRGTVGRGQYFAVGAALFAVKHLIDRVVAAGVFGLRWSLFNYWIVGEGSRLDNVPLGRLKFYATLVAIAVPFIWVGVVLTLRRLRDIGWPLWLVAAFFIPFVNLLFFLLLSTIPSKQVETPSTGLPGLRAVLDRVVPQSGVGSAALGVALTAPLAVGMTLMSVSGLGDYGWGLFVGVPFFLGLTSVLVYGYRRPRPLRKCLLVALLSVVLASAALIAVAIEGLICILMAAPLGIALALLGGAMGYIIQRRAEDDLDIRAFHAFALLLVALPALIVVEHGTRDEPALRAVRTSVEIKAAPEVVWQHLVSIAEIPPPKDLIFRTGIACPIRAEINGSGAGAVRQCVFSTGAFVEPIEVWDEPRLLKFGVTAQPPVLDELSPYSHLHPPHLNNYLQSRKGQFLLSSLPNGKTRLEGTTWYQNNFWPEYYWGIWSDYIIHRIHQRVLDHIKDESER